MRCSDSRGKALVGQKGRDASEAFCDIVARSFETSIRSLLGEKPLSALSLKLQSEFRINTKEICEKADELSHGLRSIFGQGGLVVERIFLLTLFENLGIEFDTSRKPKFDLKKELDSARRKWERLGCPDKKASDVPSRLKTL